MTTQWGLHEALSDNLSSPSIHFFFLLVKKGMNSSILTPTKPAIPNSSIADLHAIEVALFRKFRVEIQFSLQQKGKLQSEHPYVGVALERRLGTQDS